MITIIMADTPEELQKARAIMETKVAPSVEWLSVPQFSSLLKMNGYKANSHITMRKYATMFGIETRYQSCRLEFKNEPHKIIPRV